MKKIIATVLAMVMALALCSTAFAATDTWTLYKGKANNPTSNDKYVTGVSIEHKDAKNIINDKDGNVEYWAVKVEGDANAEVKGSWVACDKDDATCTLYKNNGFYAYVKLYSDEGNVPTYSKIVTEQDETDKDASCTVDHYLTDGYVDDDGDFYVQSDSGVYTARISGTNKIVKIKTSTEVVYASHILGEAVKNSDKGYYEATCLVCGAKVALTSDLDVLKKNSIKVVDTYTYDADEAEAVADDNGNEGAYAFAVGTKFAGDYTYAWDLTSGSSSSTTTDKTSPKTFDAGVAMYVGMALASVTGSAVVIGKKKEF